MRKVGFSKRGNFAALFAQGRALRTVLLWLSFFLGLLLLYLLLSWLPTLLVTDGLTRIEAAGAQIGFNIGGALAALLIGHLLGGRLRNAGIAVTFIALPILLVALAKAPAEVETVTVLVFLLGGSVMPRRRSSTWWHRLCIRPSYGASVWVRLSQSGALARSWGQSWEGF